MAVFVQKRVFFWVFFKNDYFVRIEWDESDFSVHTTRWWAASDKRRQDPHEDGYPKCTPEGIQEYLLDSFLDEGFVQVLKGVHYIHVSGRVPKYLLDEFNIIERAYVPV